MNEHESTKKVMVRRRGKDKAEWTGHHLDQYHQVLKRFVQVI